jgi:spermidine synthase
LASATTPDGKELVLYKHDADFFISIDRQDLMNSRETESELELARLGCARVSAHRNPTILLSGLGMGYTLRQALDMLQPGATVVVAELMPEVVAWNRDWLGELTGHPLRDRRVVVKTGDVCELIRGTESAFDSILLDLDNGPEALSGAHNEWIYSREGIRACARALHERGCLAVWSVSVDPRFERRLQQERLESRLFRVRSHKGGKSKTRCIWVAARDRRSLPDRPFTRLPRTRGDDRRAGRPGRGRGQ